MIYDAFAHLPLYGLEDLGFCKPGEAAAFIAERNTAPGGKLPLNTNGGGLSYMHSGMYGMYALQESVRQLRGIAAAQVAGRQDLRRARRRRHVRGQRHHRVQQRAAVTGRVAGKGESFMSYAAPFAGLKVVDLSQGVAGPYCGMLLAQHGANVIKVEPTGEGDWARTIGRRYGGHTAYSIPTNLGKRSIALDLKSDEGKEVLWRLLGGADVLIEGFRPGVLDRLGFGYDAVSEREPRILYLSVSGFGQAGPLSGRPAMDPVLQAFTGLMMDNRGEDGIPHRVPFVIIDMSTALYAFQALSAALYARRDEPRGRRIEVSLLEAASAIQVIRMMMVYLEGETVKRAMPSGVFKTADGWLQFLVIRDDSWVRFCAAIERPELATDTRFIDGDARALNEAAADGHRATRDRRAADRPLGRAPARGGHHARAAQQLPRVPAAPADGGDRPHRLARARRPARAGPHGQHRRRCTLREGFAARRHAACSGSTPPMFCASMALRPAISPR